MTNLKKIKVKIDKLIAQIEQEASKDGKVNIASKEFADVVLRLKEETLAGYGLTLEEYDEWEEKNEEELRDKTNVEGIHLELRGLENKLLKGLEQELLDKIKVVEDRKIKYGEVEETPHIPTQGEINILIKEAISEIPKQKEPDPLTREDVIKVHDWTDHLQLVSEINEIGNKIDNLKKEGKETKEIVEKTAKIKPVISQPLIKEDELEGRISKKLQEKLLEPGRRMGMGIQEQVDTLAGKITTENLWDRSGTTLSQHITGDDIDLGSGSIISSSNADITLTPNGTGRVTGVYRYIEIRLLDKDTDHTVATVGGEFRVPKAMTVKNVGAYVDTAGVTGTATIDINEAGTTILSTKVTIDTTEKTSETAAAAPVISDASIAADAIITFDIDVIQATAAKGLVVWLEVVM